jgi:hypothetical protein
MNEWNYQIISEINHDLTYLAYNNTFTIITTTPDRFL